jgi:hypothetical protein
VKFGSVAGSGIQTYGKIVYFYHAKFYVKIMIIIMIIAGTWSQVLSGLLIGNEYNELIFFSKNNNACELNELFTAN